MYWLKRVPFAKHKFFAVTFNFMRGNLIGVHFLKWSIKFEFWDERKALDCLIIEKRGK